MRADAAMSGMLAALEGAYQAIRDEHDEVPATLIVVGTGGNGGKLGHWARESWVDGEERTHELFVSAEWLNRPAAEVFGTIIHEAAHALATARGIKDHAGQRHNSRFKALAEELGMSVAQQGNRGWANTTVTDATLQKYAKAIKAIEKASIGFRSPKTRKADPDKAYKAKLSSAKSMTRWLADVEPRVLAELLSELEVKCPHCGEAY